ncbi:hypothetical protein AMTRI_Chr01g113770 [Amborella trichopoda]|uniref:uncharacterized protein LOC18440774 isoform X2 n=1 Tax=Amborella trichopoda TaxID=13333 RepID=UPI0009C00D24|nr:uncharacterized protein LOC18440774 isoform X2 [Amborella trichopoda]|eukprot:XP_020527099.1 uncharacterized protein LOC18440774 isoform X2 [Amborella trichopoda]
MLRIRRRGVFTVINGIMRASSSMETDSSNKIYVHYGHDDYCKFNRWTSRESYQFMYDRPWQHIVDFYSCLVDRRLSLSSMFVVEGNMFEDVIEETHACKEIESAETYKDSRGGRWARRTFKIVVSYHGSSFDGWQKQPGLRTVQGSVESVLGKFVDDKKAQQLRDKSLPVEGCATVAGRTDKGVSALQQVCSFYTWRTDVKTQEIEHAINTVAPGQLRAVYVSEVSRAFHPNFSAKWRHYLYIFPLKVEEESLGLENIGGGFIQCNNHDEERKEWVENGLENGCSIMVDEDYLERSKPMRFSVSKVDRILRQLEGRLLSYKMFARDTKSSRNEGPPTECFLYHARAAETRLPCPDEMVRVLVATSIREAAAGAGDDVLLRLMDATCRRATAPPAPPDGLCLVDVGYEDFKPGNTFIR